MKRRITLIICLIQGLVALGWGLNFKQVASFPFGVVTGYIKGIDANHDGYEDLIFTTFLRRGDSARVVYFGYRPFNQYIFEDSIGPPSRFWDVGDLDGDSLLDVVAQRGNLPRGLRVVEPADYWTFPKIEVWTWPYEWIGNGSQAMYITDLDKDSLREILTADAQVVYVFENRGDNQYQKVFSDTIPILPTPPFAFGDFDGDGWREFALGTYGGSLGSIAYVYECIGDDQYRMTWFDTLKTANMHDTISGPDLDGDGKLEFIFGSLRTGPSSWSAQLWICESTGNDQYEVIFADSLSVTDRGAYVVLSDCGDVDRDGRPELVWAIDRDWMVYKSPGNNQFQRVFRMRCHT